MNRRRGAEYQGAHRQVGDEPDQEVPDEVGADRQDGADLVVDGAEEEGRQVDACGREQGVAGGRLLPGVEYPQHQRDYQTGRVDEGPVEDLEPYLGALGHLVALRESDLAFLHVHPETDEGSGPRISFRATFPSEGRYRLFLQFAHAGGVKTAAFTLEV